VRTTANHYSNGPVTDVKSDAMLCYELSAGTGAPKTLEVTAGSTLLYNAKASISHPGPMAVYIAKVPAGQTAATFNGKGAIWAKIYQDRPSITSGGMTWPAQGKYNFGQSALHPNMIKMACLHAIILPRVTWPVYQY
jgi:hypothetical protein